MGRRPARTKAARAKQPPAATANPGPASGTATSTARPRRRFTLSQAAAAVIAAVIALFGVIINTYEPFDGEPAPTALTPHPSGSPSTSDAGTGNVSASPGPTHVPSPTHAATPTRTGQPPPTTPFVVRTPEPARPTTTLRPIQIDGESYKELYWGRTESINLA